MQQQPVIEPCNESDVYHGMFTMGCLLWDVYHGMFMIGLYMKYSAMIHRLSVGVLQSSLRCICV